MTKGTRYINGQQYLLCGRVADKADAVADRKLLLESWHRVRIIKLSNWDFMLYVHGRK